MYGVKEGGGLLCVFLDVPCSTCAFPKGERFEANVANISLLAGLWCDDVDALY